MLTCLFCENLRGCDAVEGIVFMRIVSVEVRPELDKKECVLGSLVKQLLESPRLLREFILDLPNVHWLKAKKDKAYTRLEETSGQLPQG